MKFEDRSHEESERQQRCARSKAWNLAKNISSSKKKTRLISSFPQRNGDSWLRQQKSWRKESLQFIQEPVCIWSVRKNLALLSWRPWGYGEVPRQWRPTARCKPDTKPRYLSKNWTYSWHLCFLKKHPQSSHSGSSARIIGILTTGPAVKNHISPKMARELIAIFQIVCHSQSLVYRRVPQQHPHLLFQHLHHRIPYLMSRDTPKIQYQKEVEVRVESFGETRCMNPQKPKTKKKKKRGTQRSTKRYIARIAWLATRIQGEFCWWKYFNRALGKPRARKSRHFQSV